MRLAYKPLIATCLTFLLVLSGCIGGDDNSKPNTSNIGNNTGIAPTTPTDIVDCTADGDPSDCAGSRDPKRHFHHYWGDPPMAEVLIFDAELTFDTDAFAGGEFSCRSMGTKEFNLESDGDDAINSPDSQPVNPVTNRADTVFAGTDYINVTLESIDLQLPAPAALFFRYKPANLNFYLPENGCGTKILPGGSFNIPVGDYAADPPHQWAVSRWSFFVIVANDELSGNELPTFTGPDSKFRVTMRAHNGGEASLDPAHPDLWKGSLTYDLGCTEEDNIERQIVVWAPNTPAIHQPPRKPLIDIAWMDGRIVPLLTMKVDVTVSVTNSAANAGWELWYFGADTDRYERLGTSAGAEGTFSVDDPDGLKADPPYLPDTLWRFMILPLSQVPPLDIPATPVSPADKAQLGVFEGSFTLCAIAHRDPNKILE